MAIVPSDVYPKDKLQPDDKIVGSGQYTVASYEPGQQTGAREEPQYGGAYPAKNDRAIVQYFDKPSALKLAVEQGDVDVAYRSFSPTDLQDLKSASGLSVVGGSGTEIRYLVFNENLQPGSSDAQKLAVRRAVAYTIDRQAIADNVYDGTVTPLYSMVPQGLQYATEPFKDEYGASPDVDAAKAELQKAGVKAPVDLEVWYTPTHYGTGSADEYAEIQHQLEDSGLFNVTLKSTEWNQYDEAALTDKYPQFQFGWFPDYPDADDYTAPFFATTSFLNDHYSNPKIDKLLADEQGTTNYGRAPEGVRADPEDRGAGRANDPDLAGRPGRGGSRRSPRRRGHIRSRIPVPALGDQQGLTDRHDGPPAAAIHAAGGAGLRPAAPSTAEPRG